jgi:hypothetical protein
MVRYHGVQVAVCRVLSSVCEAVIAVSRMGMREKERVW